MRKIFFGSSQHFANTESCNSQCATKTHRWIFKTTETKTKYTLHFGDIHTPNCNPAYRIGITPMITFQKTETRPSQIVQIPKHPLCLMSHVSLYIDVKQFNAIGGAATSLHMNTSMLSFGSHRFETPCVPHCTAKKNETKKEY